MAQQHSLSTSSGAITIAQAQPPDIDIVISILEEAGQWLSERGIYQWLLGSFRHDRIASSIELGQVYLAKQGEEISCVSGQTLSSLGLLDRQSRPLPIL